MKIAAVVILYYPETKVLENIQSYSSYIDVIFAIDNSERTSQPIKQLLSQINNCVYLSDGENKGIAARLNEACEMARHRECEWLLTMDQDSSFSEGVFVKYLHQFEGYNKDEVAMFAVNYMPEFISQQDEPTQVLSTITSGSLVNLSLNKIIGKYNEKLFIDLVDAEYCYRAYNLNYKVVLFSNIVLNHRIGYIQYGRSFKSFKLTPRLLHNPLRVYYIVRNCFYMLYKYPNLPQQAKKELWNCLKLLKNNLLYHKQRSQVIKNIVRGYLDYKKNKMGKFAP